MAAVAFGEGRLPRWKVGVKPIKLVAGAYSAEVA
jgi:hypothetical protein